jgi:putative aminopeptidase FrvX
LNQESFEFLKAIEETPSPSGFEQPVQRIVRRRMKAYADTIESDVHGNLIVGLNPKGKPRVMLAGHCDQIGLMVKHIDDDGYLFCLPGVRVTVHTRTGPVDGIIGRRPVHLLKQEERGAKVELRELWIDVGIKGKKQVEKKIALADPVTFRLGLERLGKNMITSPGLDNKVGTFVVMEALRLVSKKRVPCALFAVSTVQEEIGLRGAATSCFGLDPQVGIAVDVTHATDYPDMDKRTHGVVKIGLGPTIAVGANTNPTVSDLLIRTAKARKIPHQIEAEPRGTGTDANVIQITRAGVAAGLLSVPNRYMHTQVETVDLTDLENCVKLLAETIARITPQMNFIPQ